MRALLIGCLIVGLLATIISVSWTNVIERIAATTFKKKVAQCLRRQENDTLFFKSWCDDVETV